MGCINTPPWNNPVLHRFFEAGKRRNEGQNGRIQPGILFKTNERQSKDKHKSCIQF